MLNHMTSLSMLEEMTATQRDKIYVYSKYLGLLEEGAELFLTNSILES